MLFSNKRLPLAAAITAFVAATPVAAQQLEEVIVTAQKRAENLQDVPISVSTVSGEKIADNTIVNFAALADFVPSLHIADAPVNTNIYMRGIGSGNNRGFEQSVGMYLDGVYLGRGRQYRSALMDVERIEVLRGPQGTLFGKNTVAGAINISSASPVVGDDASGAINASIEENGGQIYDAYIQGGSETFAARLALRYRETDGYIYNAYLEEDEGALEETGGRLTLVWQPSDTFSANMKYTNMRRDRDGSASATYRFLPAGTGVDERDGPIGAGVPGRSAFASIAYTLMDTFFPDFPSVAGEDFTTYKDNNCGLDTSCSEAGIGYKPENSDDDIQNFSLNMNWDVGNGTLTSVTGWAGYEYNDDVDVDWLPLQFIDRSDIHDFHQFSQEFRWASDIGDRFTYTVGAYYDENELDMEGQVGIDTNFDGLFPQFAQVAYGAPFPNLLTLLTGGAYGSNQITRNHNFNQETESFAFFAQGTYELTDSLRLTAGLRYTEEEKDAVSSQRLGDQNCASDPNPTDPKSVGMTGACAEGYSYFLDIIQAQNFNTYNKEWVGSRKTDDLSPSLNMQWDMSDSSMLYVSWSQGFKSGGFSAADDGEPGDFGVAQLPPPGGFVSTVPNADFEFDDESVDSIEIGGKHEFLDGAMRLNWAAFYSEYEDLQTTIFKGVGFSVKNAASSEVQGFEVDWLLQVTDGLRVGVNAAYLDATYGDFPDGPCNAYQLDANSLCGTPQGISEGLPFAQNDLTEENTLYASDWSGNAFADFRMPLGAMELFAGVDVNYRSDFMSAGDNDEKDGIDAYTKVNARIGLGGDRWEIMAYGRNIFDEAALQQSFDTPVLAGSHTQYMDEGAVFGVRGTLRF